MNGISLPLRLREQVETVLLIAVLVALTTGPVYFVAYHFFHNDGMWEARPIKLGFLISGFVSGCVWLSMATAGRLKRLDAPLVVAGSFVALAVASTAWSILPRQTAWRSSVYVAMFLLAWSLASLTFDRLWTVLIGCFGLATGTSIVLALVRPAMGIATDSGNWKGIYTSPNSLGPVCGLFIITMVGLVVMNQSRPLRLTAGSLAVVALVPLLRSSAETAVLALAIALLSSLALYLTATRVARRDKRTRAIVAMVAALTTVAAVGVALPVLGRTSGIELRWEVWKVVWERILIKPWIGYGFFTYWGTGASMQPRTIARAGSSHNSILEAGLDLGAIGMVLVGVIIIAAVAFSARRLWRSPSPQTALIFSVAVFVALSHMTESFVSWFSYMFVLLVVVASHPPSTVSRSGAPVSDETLSGSDTP